VPAATLVAGPSAHVFHGVADRVLFDLGDFLDDYAVDHELRNDMGLPWLVELSAAGPRRIRALPLVLEHCLTRRASAGESDWIERRPRHLCARFGTDVERSGGLIEVPPRRAPAPGDARSRTAEPDERQGARLSRITGMRENHRHDAGPRGGVTSDGARLQR
jgi:hypothetical protein